MLRLPRPAVTAALAVAVTGCGAAPASTARDADARRAIEHTVADYVNATNRGDVRALAELYAEDAILLPPEDTLVRGRDGIREFWSRGLEGGLSVEEVRLDVTGESAFLVARYTLAATADEAADSGKCAMSFARQRDGSWKLTADIWNNDTGGADDSTDDAAPLTPIT
jgi:uncharacterized protein (TIGR02246 family)